MSDNIGNRIKTEEVWLEDVIIEGETEEEASEVEKGSNEGVSLEDVITKELAGVLDLPTGNVWKGKEQWCFRETANYQCNYCNLKFQSKKKIRAHIKNHNVDGLYSSKHNRKGSGIVKNCTREKPDICGTRDRRFSQKVGLEGHLKTQAKTRSAKKLKVCDVCDHGFVDNSGLRRHMLSHTDEKPCSCDICGSRFKLIRDLKRHTNLCHGEPQTKKKFPCSMCDFSCNRADNLRRHEKSHTGEKPFSCSQCEFRSSVRYVMDNHMKTHTGERPFACDLCEYKTNRQDVLKYHLTTHILPGKQRGLSCSYCDFKSIYASNVRSHMRTHTGEKSFACDSCDYRSSHPCHLKAHRRIHTGEKPYRCRFCEYQSSYKTPFDIHVRKYHTGEKPYMCHKCDFKAYSSSQLLSHFRKRGNLCLPQQRDHE